LNQHDWPKEAWCAAHLKMLCTSAVDAFEKYGFYTSNKTSPRGFLVNYESLPGIIGRVLLPFFGVEPSITWLQKMMAESSNYSKGKSMTKTFVTDSFDKENRATSNIRTYADLILNPVFWKLENLSFAVFQNLNMNNYARAGMVDWKSLKEIPIQLLDESSELAKLRISRTRPSENSSYSISGNRHSALSKLEYQPWLPFGNSHRSQKVEVFLLSCIFFMLHLRLDYRKLSVDSILHRIIRNRTISQVF
jgi:hypothetical protein